MPDQQPPISQPETQPSVPLTQPPPSPTAKFPWQHIAIIAILVALISVAAAAYFYYQSPQPITGQTTTTITTTSPTPTIPFSTPTISADPTTNWKVISRELWEFKVPPNWNYWECNSELIFVGPSIQQDQTYKCAFDVSPGVVQVSRINKLENPYYKIPIESTEDHIISNVSPITIDNTPATIQLERVTQGQGQGTRWIVYVEKSTKYLYIITLHDASQKQTTFNQILSTFKFLDNSQLAGNVTGSMVLYRSQGVGAFTFQLSAQSTAGEVTDMLVWTDTRSEKDQTWQSFEKLFTVYPRSGELDYSKVFIKFKDSLGNVSPTYSETVTPSQGPPNADY